MTRRVVVVGASLAGATAATTLRELGYDGALDVVGDEPVLPYERPALSKSYLAGDSSLEKLHVNDAATYESADIRLHLGAAAVALDVHQRTVALADGTSLPYDALVIATGSVNRRPDLPGTDLAGVHQLRTVADADALRERAAHASSAVLVGQGFVGCEVAATLRASGLDVTMVDPLPGPLHGPLGPEVSGRVARWHLDHGVRLVNDVGITELTGRDSVDGVRLSDGTALTADLVVVGVGARPASDWLGGSGVALQGGAVLVDADGRSGVPGVHAAGDVSAWWDDDLGEHRRVEHYDSALVQGQRVAHTILGSRPPARGRSWFWTDQYDHTLQFAGERRTDDELVWRAGRTGFWVRDGRVTAVVSIDDGRTFRRAMALIRTSQDRSALVDEGVDLRTLRPAKQSAALPSA